MANDANGVMFRRVSVLDKDGIFTELRLDDSTVDAGLFRFDVRHSDDDDSVPVQIEEYVDVNFYGTVLTNEDLTDEFGNIIFLEDPEEDFYFYGDDEITMDEYLDELEDAAV